MIAKTLQQVLEQCLDDILIPPLIAICYEFLMPLRNQKHWTVAQNTVWGGFDHWRKCNYAIRDDDVQAFEQTFASLEQAVQMPWILLHRAVADYAFDIAFWLLEHGIQEYHPTAVAVLEQVVRQNADFDHKFDRWLRNRDPSRKDQCETEIGIRLLEQWRVPLMLSQEQSSVRLESLSKTSIYQYLVDHCPRVFLTDWALPIDFHLQVLIRWQETHNVRAMAWWIRYLVRFCSTTPVQHWKILYQQARVMWNLLPGQIQRNTNLPAPSIDAFLLAHSVLFDGEPHLVIDSIPHESHASESWMFTGTNLFLEATAEFIRTTKPVARFLLHNHCGYHLLLDDRLHTCHRRVFIVVHSRFPHNVRTSIRRSQVPKQQPWQHKNCIPRKNWKNPVLPRRKWHFKF